MKKTFIYIFLIFTLPIFSGCGNESSKKQEGETEAHEEHAEGNITTLTKAQMQSIGVVFGSIEKKQLTSSLKANGILKVPNQNRASITALLGGVVKSIRVQSGSQVRKGDVIATLTNTSFITMQEEFISTSSRVVLAEQEYKRQSELQAGNAGTLKTLQQAEAELKALRVRKTSLHRQLELIGIKTSTLSEVRIQSEISVISPINGSVSEVLINIGSFVDANKPVAEIIDNSQLHVDLFVYEKDLPKLRIDQTIHFTLTNNTGKEYDAKIYGISNTFEQNTKAISVHAVVSGDKSGLIDGMNITALVSLEKATVDAIPTDAIVSYQGNDYIFIVTKVEEQHHEEENGKAEEEHKHEKAVDGTLTFERIPVHKGTSEIGFSEITLLKEIPVESEIVIKGAFFILSKMTNSGEHEH